MTKIITKLKNVWKAHPEVIFAYIFGSSVKGMFNPESDIDIAVYLQDGVNSADFIFSIMPKIVRMTGRDKIDLVVLNEAPLSLRYIIQKNGILIFEKNEEYRTDFETRTRLSFWDYEPHLKVYESYMLKRLVEGTFGT